ncbi:MAG TPA: hypothetical protein VG755_37890, partial [Nannocystaceae bacterium]|nr:hypothetical protein [Nannocystaceae bacterium]
TGLTTSEWGRALAALQRRIAFFGAHDSLAQRVLQLAAPGVCDVYQGTELWDLSLVDPDNRRAIDFDARERMLTTLVDRDAKSLLAELRESWSDGRIKAWVTWRGLQLRRDHPQCFLESDVQCVDVEGDRAQHVCALSRHDGVWMIAAVARLTATLVDPPAWPIGACWNGQALRVPVGAPTRWRSWTGNELVAEDGVLALSEVFADLPCAMLVGA